MTDDQTVHNYESIVLKLEETLTRRDDQIDRLIAELDNARRVSEYRRTRLAQLTMEKEELREDASVRGIELEELRHKHGVQDLPF